MFYEYALEPQLLKNWSDFRFFVSQFGFEKGRLISQFPKKWKRMVYESLGDCEYEERSRIEEALRRIDDRMIRRQRQWDGLDNWLQNAISEHGRRPFRAIVASSNPDTHAATIVGAKIDDSVDFAALDADDPLRLWHAPRSEIVRRDSTAMASAIEQLLLECTQLMFVDKHFGPENRRHRIPFEAFLERVAARESGTLPSVEFHLADKAAQVFFQQKCDSELPRLVPNAMSVRLVRWAVHCLHNRFILSDKGGVAFLEGLDVYQGNADQREEDVVVILDDVVCKQLIADYDIAAGKLVYIDEHTIVGTKTT